MYNQPYCCHGKTKEAIDLVSNFGPLLIDLPKVFDCLDSSLLTGKLYRYVLNFYSISNTQQTKRKLRFSSRSKMEYGIPQSLILDLPLFNIALIDIFYKSEDYMILF